MSPFLDRSDRSCGGGVADPGIQVPGAYPATLPSPQGTGLLEVGGGGCPQGGGRGRLLGDMGGRIFPPFSELWCEGRDTPN